MKYRDLALAVLDGKLSLADAKSIAKRRDKNAEEADTVAMAYCVPVQRSADCPRRAGLGKRRFKYRPGGVKGGLEAPKKSVRTAPKSAPKSASKPRVVDVMAALGMGFEEFGG